ncbi:carboxypeptidase-like regulatory domain-containing protein [Aquimarina sp. D1M17]|uniref:carboxypeptidase-like regulatory domain-containing protein n=1 Tax=Aquimarina acroporae TaxID=2937283 RepID=UPI0020C1337C|nr:carboxypeptidase-like regulatory domain-containing protein [Aquimarina acroporae]MCK8522096.1 carboxypeptidase-like regulatory domain-containing protein [Aquimarina acroporae]
MKYKFFLLLFFLLGLIGYTQEDKGIRFSNIGLDEFLTELETKYDVKFSYNSSSFEGFSISLEIDNATLSGILNKVSEDYPFQFNKVDERYYVVKLEKEVTVCGYLLDEQNTPMTGATILNESRKIGVLSNDQGFFSIKKNKINDTLTFSFIGYKTAKVKVKDVIDPDCTKITLQQESFMLNEVLIKEYLASGMVKKRNGAVEIKPKELELISGVSEPDVLQNIQLLPGIESPLETASGIYIRGGTPDQNLILWDGIKMYNSDHFFGLISAFNPYILEGITIFKNGTQSQYGDRVAGVIDIKTEDAIPNTVQGGVGVNMTHGDAYLKIPLSKKTGLLVSGRRSITDILETPTITKFSNRAFQNTSISSNKSIFDPEFTEIKEQFYFTDVTWKLTTHISDKHKLAVSSLYTRNKLDYSFSDIEFADSSSDKLGIKNFGTNLSWEGEWSPKFSTRSEITYSEYDLEYEGRNMFFNQNQIITKENDIQEFGFLFNSDWKLGANFVWSNGYQLYSDKVGFIFTDTSDIFENEQDNSINSFYTQLQYRGLKSWLVNLGVRASYYAGLNKSYLEPRLFVEKKLGKHFSLNSSAELKNQSISQVIEFATFNFGLENQVWILAQEDGFPLLQSRQFTVGGLFNKGNWNIEVDSYYKKVKGLTSLTRGFETLANGFSEGESISQGIDVLIKKKIGKYTSWLGYSFSDTMFTFDDINNGNSFQGNNNIAHSLSWSHALQLNKFQFSLGWKYRTGIPFTQATGFEIIDNQPIIQLEEANARNLPDYHRLDFSMVYDFNWSKNSDKVKGRLGVSLLNLYEQKNILNRTFTLYQLQDQEGNISFELREVNKFSLGITPNLTFRLSF